MKIQKSESGTNRNHKYLFGIYLNIRNFWLLLPVLISAGCTAPSVNLETPKPLEVDIKMRVDVYEHPAPEAASDKEAAAKRGSAQTDSATVPPDIARRNRMADIQVFKNSRLIGEGHDGLLSILEKPPGEYGDYVTKIVAEENKDRMMLMSAQADKDKKPLLEFQSQKAAEWRKRSFTGEWFEEPQADGSFKWMQKK